MPTLIRHREGSHDHRRRTAGPAGSRSRRLSSAAKVAADIALAALGAALIMFSGQYSLGPGVATLVLIAAVAVAAARLVQAFRGRVELGVLRQPLRPDLRPHLLQLLNYALLAALILIAGALGTFTNVPFYAGILGLPLPDSRCRRAAGGPRSRRAGARACPRVRPVWNLAVLSFSIFLAVSLAPALAPPRAAVAIDLPLEGEWAMVAGGRSTLLSHHYTNPSRARALDFARMVGGQAFAGDPEHHASWHSFGQPVLAPADGTVVSVRDHLAEEPVGVARRGSRGQRDRPRHRGLGATSLLEHLQQDSALVRAGPVRHTPAADRRRRQHRELPLAAPACADPGPPDARQRRS